MKKDHIRDYATHAFREYAAAGCPTYDQLRDKLIADAAASSGERLNVKSGISKPTEAQIMAAEKQLENAEGQLMDILAVIRTIEILQKRRDGDLIFRCLKLVYFAEPKREPDRGEISDRVQYVSYNEHVGERTVYRKLYVARRIFATERKLNTKI